LSVPKGLGDTFNFLAKQNRQHCSSLHSADSCHGFLYHSDTHTIHDWTELSVSLSAVQK